ncbi:glycosyl transferase family 2 [Thermogladius calderae 1633]|uniref:Glycosyl transferase family 2 n=1 Tax=Thermogladius calderae (strain DSM 22663 / VKM B-2946 / 1633) TaxID=1184251 RepID=I3TCW9_THEC1|nr:glycosyl transferase family 2 [Thermogladius calderae 1633]
MRNLDARYFTLLNNDLVAEPGSLRKVIEHMDEDEKVAASGLLYYLDKNLYSTGGWIDEVLVLGSICNGLTVGDCPAIVKSST